MTRRLFLAAVFGCSVAKPAVKSFQSRLVDAEWPSRTPFVITHIDYVSKTVYFGPSVGTQPSESPIFTLSDPGRHCVLRGLTLTDYDPIDNPSEMNQT